MFLPFQVTCGLRVFLFERIDYSHLFLVRAVLIRKTGQMKDIATTTLGLFLFKDVVFGAINLVGVGLGLSGGIAYSAISYGTKQ